MKKLVTLVKLNRVIVEENVLRQKVTTDVSTGSGQFDIFFIDLSNRKVKGNP